MVIPKYPLLPIYWTNSICINRNNQQILQTSTSYKEGEKWNVIFIKKHFYCHHVHTTKYFGQLICHHLITTIFKTYMKPPNDIQVFQGFYQTKHKRNMTSWNIKLQINRKLQKKVDRQQRIYINTTWYKHFYGSITFFVASNYIITPERAYVGFFHSI